MKELPVLNIKDYSYELPDGRIALYPLAERDASKLLVYRKGEIHHAVFKNISEYLPNDSLLVFNDTKVVQARLLFTRKTSGIVEVFCLEPLSPHREMSQAMQQRERTVWRCMAKKLKRWQPGEILYIPLPPYGKLEAKLISKEGKFADVEFSWEPKELSWAQVLELAGKVPLPPYLHRTAEEKDKETYQTVYANVEGAVAAPTAGLHFTKELLEKLENKGVEKATVTLHVSAGTFQPVEVENALHHPMHNEQIVFVKNLIEKLSESDKFIIPVGTTSLRALESLYWFGVQIVNFPGTEKFFIPSMLPYSDELKNKKIPRKDAMKAIMNWMKDKDIETLFGQTEIFIFPGYQFRMAGGLITNFHQPQSTLILLVAAMIGEKWREIYNEALKKDYRFLSYGDGSLLLP
jgi:S-adenosylmethionine:tRNA ribosyltransferase-isomerase